MRFSGPPLRSRVESSLAPAKPSRTWISTQVPTSRISCVSAAGGITTQPRRTCGLTFPAGSPVNPTYQTLLESAYPRGQCRIVPLREDLADELQGRPQRTASQQRSAIVLANLLHIGARCRNALGPKLIGNRFQKRLVLLIGGELCRPLPGNSGRQPSPDGAVQAKHPMARSFGHDHPSTPTTRGWV